VSVFAGASLEVRDEDGMLKMMSTSYRNAAADVRRAVKKMKGGADNAAAVRTAHKRLTSERENFFEKIETDSVGLDVCVCTCVCL